MSEGATISTPLRYPEGAHEKDNRKPTMLCTASLLALTLLAPASPVEVQRYDALHLAVDLVDFPDFSYRAGEEGDQLLGSWAGELGRSRVRIEARVFANKDFRINTPRDILGISESHYQGLMKKDSGTSSRSRDEVWRFDRDHFIPGPYGYAPYTIIGEKLDKTAKPARTVLCMGGVGKRLSYAIEVLATPPLDEVGLAKMLAFLKDRVRYDGEVYNREWDEDEVERRWQRDVPDKLQDDLEAFRTKHFLILTNSSGKKKFAKELEKSYEAIKQMFPFEEREELRLLPIFLFRTNDQYYDFCVKTLGWTRDAARDSKGVAWMDFYATWYEAPKDPVHIHELTHQLFENRLYLGGGGSWFQEGVAEYMSTTKTERKQFKRLVKKAKYVPFDEFLLRRSLLGSSGDTRVDGTDPTTEAYLQAACIIEFVHRSKWSGGKLQDFIHAIGSTGYNDLAEIDAALQRVFGVDVAGFEQQFVKYWTKR